MKLISVVLCVVLFSSILYADYSSLTAKERSDLITAVEMSGEYRYLLDGSESRKIIEAVNVSGYKWRVRIELGMKKANGEYRYIVRDIYIDIHSKQSISWPWLVASCAAGIVSGILIAK